MNTRSPFSENRFEYELQHLYYLQEDIYTQLERPKPCVLLGSRGTGKTTLLKSLSWRERLSNEGLKAQLNTHEFDAYIGIYIKLPDVQLDAIRRWLSGADDLISRAIYSRYLELIQLQEVFEAVAELEVAGRLSYSARSEREFVQRIATDFRGEIYSELAGVKEPKSLVDLAGCVRSIRRIIERASQQGETHERLLDLIGSPTQIAELSRDIARRLSDLISANKEVPMTFKVCFDEAETLDEFGVRVLSTWIRLSTAPLYHVISFVSKPASLEETCIPGLTLQSADLAILDLDNMTDGQFRQFAEGVATLRLHEAVRRELADPHVMKCLPFKTERHFGKLNINFLLESALRNSVSPIAKDVLAKAEARVPQLHPREGSAARRRGDDAALPIYETYLELRTNREVASEPDAPRWSKRKAESQFVRKAMVSAYLSLMSELRISPTYAYADMILQLSDGCIRDYLNSLEHIYQASRLPIGKFVSNSVVPATIQNAGLLEASRAKIQSLPTYGVNHPSSTAKLVRGFGWVTRLLQTKSHDGMKHLRSTERGIFVLPAMSNDPVSSRALRLVVDAAEAGFLKRLPDDSDLNVRFRVHTSLAPEFGFSYRGAYYPVDIAAADVIAFADAADDAEISKLSNSLFVRMDGGSGVDLFSGESL